MKFIALALMGMIASTAVVAQTVSPFKSDGCVPGLNALGQFVDEGGKVLESQGWVATAANLVFDAAGKQVYLRANCAALAGNLGANGLTVGLGVAAGVAAVALSTSSTNGTTN